MSKHNIPEDILGFLSACLVTTLLVAATWAPQAPDAAEPDAPAQAGACALYFTHEHVGAKSYQLTCRDPQPDSITLYPRRESAVWRGGDTLQ